MCVCVCHINYDKIRTRECVCKCRRSVGFGDMCVYGGDGEMMMVWSWGGCEYGVEVGIRIRI